MIYDIDVYLLYLAVVLGSAYCWLVMKWNYWSKRSVSHIKPSLRNVFNPESEFQFYKNLYLKTAPHKYAGFYFKLSTPTLLIRDPGLIKEVLSEQFENFPDKQPVFYSATDPLTHSIFNQNGHPWKQTRDHLTPAFTSVKLRPMVQLMADSATALKTSLARRMEESNSDVLNVNIMATEYQTDVLASCMFGINGKTIGNPKSTVLQMIQCIFGSNYFRLKFNNLLNWLPPNWRHYVSTHILDETAVSFFRQQMEEVIKLRKENCIQGTDVLQYFMNLMELTKESNGDVLDWTFESSLAHSIIFTCNGLFELATDISLALYEIARNEEVQMKLRNEIEYHLSESSGQLTYELLCKMTYLHQVILETFRKYPRTYAISRICKKTCLLSELVVEEGTRVTISVSGIHHDPEYYPEPEKFNPERFNENRKKSRHLCTYLPFGLGPRKCLAEQFSVLCIKAAITSLLSQFAVSVRPEDVLSFEHNSNDIDPNGNNIRLQFTKKH